MLHVTPDQRLAGELSPAAALLLALCLLTAGAQALAIPPDTPALAAGADEIVRGEITDVHADWTTDHATIVTTATVHVTARAKGTGPDTLALTVPGGTADGVTLEVEDQPVLAPGTEAFLFVAHTPGGDRVHGGQPGVVPIENGQVLGGTTKESGVSADAYGEYLAALATGRPAAAPTPAPGPVTRAVLSPVPVITNVSPVSASAGTGTTITITGTGFGTKASRDSYADVGFSRAFPVSPIWASGYPVLDRNPDGIVSWSDTRIVVTVPTGYTASGAFVTAASGCVWVVTDANVASAYHPFAVTFSYGGSRWGGPAPYRVNATGMIPGALPAITGAAGAWNAAVADTPFRLEYAGASSTARIGLDGENLVLLGDPGSFAGVFAAALTYVWRTGDRIDEVDLVLNPWTTWTLDPGASGTSLPKVALHEFGHWLYLKDLYSGTPGYPTDAGKVMFGEDAGALPSALSPDDVAGIRWIYANASPPSPTPTATVPRPFNGPHAMPGRVEAEDYDAGGEGVAYHDTTPANEGGAYRSDGVDIEAANGRSDVGWVRSGEWLSYTVNSSAPQRVAVRLRAANPDASRKSVTVYAGGGRAGWVEVPSTGSFDAYATMTGDPEPLVWLPAGETALRLELPDRVNLDYLELVPAAAPNATPITKTPTPTPEPTQPEWALEITAPGRCVLDHDLAGGINGVRITSSNVVLDGAGHEVSFSGAAGSSWGTGVEVRGPTPEAPLSNVTVRNLSVRGWSQGLDLLDATGVLVEGVTAAENSGWGLRTTGCDAVTVRSSVFSDNDYFGVALYTPGAGFRVEGCSAWANGMAGIGVVGPRDAVSVPVLEADDVRDNAGWGVIVEQPVDDGGGVVSTAGAAVGNSTVLRNGGGGVVVRRCEATIGGIRVEDNGGPGVSVILGGTARVTRNRVGGNAIGLATGSAGDPSTLEACDNLLNNTVNTDLAPGGTIRLNATRSAGPNIVGEASIGGNFWGAPDGTGFSQTHADANGDGFIDTPFVDASGAVDSLPLAAPVLVSVPGGAGTPTDTNGDGVFDDVNGNGRADFADVVLYFTQMGWIAANEPVGLFDYNGNGRIDFADVVWLFNRL